MNERIHKLREQSLNAINRISSERALLITDFYKNHADKNDPIPVQRAKAFAFILQQKSICINDDELIIGERGPAPKDTPTYPEICVHTLQDLEILNSREKVSFRVDEKTKSDFENIIIPFWTGKTNRERIMQAMTPEWAAAYKAGVFTEFQEQRAPGHTVLGDVIYKKGMLDLINEIKQSKIQIAKRNDSNASEKLNELDAMEIAATAIIRFSERHAEKIHELAIQEKNEIRQTELFEIENICRHVPAHVPRTFHEALQYYWFVHLGVITELNPWDSFNPGRLDQHLYPFYKAERDAGTLTQERASELLQAFWIKFNNHPSPPKVGITAQESNTYTDFCLINTGGVDENGNDAVNELSFLILDVIEEMRLLQPGSMIQVSEKNSDAFIHRALKIIKTGFGQPSIFNTDAIIKELLTQGKDIYDARRGGASGCVETGAFGTEAYFLTGYFNLTKILEITLNNGINPSDGIRLGPATGNPVDFESFEEFMDAFRSQIEFFVNLKIEGNRKIENIFSENLPVPFLSLLIDDCILKGIDYTSGGARYNTSYIQGVGLGSVTDSLTSLKYNCFDQKTYSMQTLLEAMHSNFEGKEEMRYHLLYETPKYGNDDDNADSCMKNVFDIYYNAVNGKPNTRGGLHRINLLPTTCHVYFGKVTGAMPDGRRAGTPLSEGISPVQGADQFGPTSVLQSAAKIDHLRTGGTLLNQKFTPEFFEDDEAIKKLCALIRGYFRMYGHHIQFNVVAAETLRDAQKKPELHRDLIVRVAGYSDYFNDLGRDLQDEIICRTEH